MEKTDLEKFIELYASFGIPLEVIQENNGQVIMLGESVKHSKHGYSEKFNGYACFFSDVRFDENGKFVSQGFWE